MLVSHIALESLETHTRSHLTQHGTYGRYASSGHLIYADSPQYTVGESTGRVLTSPLDLKTLKVTGSELPLVENVWVSANGSAQFALSVTGTFVYAPFTTRGPRTLVWVDRQGRSTPLSAPAREYKGPRLSPDENRVALSVVDGPQTDVWTYDIRRSVLARVTSDGISDMSIWKPDGVSVVYGSRHPGPQLNLYMQPADPAAEAVRLAPSPIGQFPASFSPTGDVLLFNERGGDATRVSYHTSELTIDGKSSARVLITGPKQWYVGARISPDGHWVAYVSDQEGPFEVYVQSYPSGQNRRRVSAVGGMEAVWAKSGRELYWRHDNKMMAAAFDAAKSDPLGEPREVFEQPGYFSGPVAYPQFDVTRDGRFLMIREGDRPPPPNQLNVVLNWIEELRTRAGSAK
jgi:eukaryotic-like serine/threonine-protein kinase